MTRSVLWNLGVLALAALAMTVVTNGAAAEPDIYSAAVAHPGRSDADLKRDRIDHPAEVLRLAGLKPGMQVGDLLAADGYYSELASYIVGPTGHVLMLNDLATDYWSNNGWEKRLAGNRLPNVEHRRIELEHLPLPDASLDAMLVIKVYHDFYWVDDRPNSPWPKLDPQAVLNEIARVVKPGGVLLVVDHSAKSGTGKADAGRLHRIAESYARSDFEKHGFQYVATTDVLHVASDDRSLISYEPPILGHTHRFVLVFHRRGA
ncbi:MAG TPA: methyltransferase domain-containing protein [Terriglobales bacterium]|nr:methyltransferase domain-containing protein [Terriglobales bacterium]